MADYDRKVAGIGDHVQCVVRQFGGHVAASAGENDVVGLSLPDADVHRDVLQTEAPVLLIEEAIQAEIEPTAWNRCDHIERAERESLRTVLDSWKGAA